MAEPRIDRLRLGRLRPFFTINSVEKDYLRATLRAPLSGYLGGIDEAGYWVERLQSEWCSAFKCNHAIACNSATSGLLAACMAIGIKPGDTVWTSAYSMSATAACAKVLGANIVFIDIETKRFSMNTNHFAGREPPKCVIATNLFGHPAYLSTMRSWCDSNKVILIEDNAQAPFAMENGRYAGTIGHIGVFSLNVHKHIQCGEGGVVITDDNTLALAAAGAINHGELAGRHAGLNLRMTEPIAAIACAQLSKAHRIIPDRIELAEELTDMFSGIPWLIPQTADVGCRHVYYVWAAQIINGKRRELVAKLNERKFPMREGYSKPLNYIFDSAQTCHIAEEMEFRELITFEVCRYNPTKHQRKRMRNIVRRVMGELA